MARNEPSTYGTDVACFDDADGLFSAVTGIGSVIQDAYHRITTDDILGPGGKFGEDEAGLRQSAAAVQALLDREAARGIAPSRTVLMGFSQGCAMTLMTALRYPERLGGAIGMSGYLPLAATTAAERSPANADLPIFLAHGTQDPIVVLPRGTASRDALVALGHQVEWHDYPMPHSVCAEEIQHINAWLLKQLG